MQTCPITQEGYNKLLLEYENLKKVKMPAIIQKIAEARSLGDLKENAEYHAAREEQGHIQARIVYLSDCISRSQIISVEERNLECVVFGSKVKTRNLEDDCEEEFILVGPAEIDPAEGKISTASPLGKSLMGKKISDTIVYKTPSGRTMSFKILSIS